MVGRGRWGGRCGGRVRASGETTGLLAGSSNMDGPVLCTHVGGSTGYGFKGLCWVYIYMGESAGPIARA